MNELHQQFVALSAARDDHFMAVSHDQASTLLVQGLDEDSLHVGVFVQRRSSGRPAVSEWQKLQPER